jgi:hypothetical protein
MNQLNSVIVEGTIKMVETFDHETLVTMETTHADGPTRVIVIIRSPDRKVLSDKMLEYRNSGAPVPAIRVVGRLIQIGLIGPSVLAEYVEFSYRPVA